MRNNYALQTSQAAALFLTYDPDNMVRLHGLERADDRIEVLFMDCRTAVSLKDGHVTMMEPEGRVRDASFDEAMTLYEYLCYPKTKPEAAGIWASISELGGVVGSYHAQHLQPREDRDVFSGHTERLRREALAMGGTDAGTSGDVSVILPVLPGFRMWFQFWDGDEEFPPHDQFLFDRNALSFLRYETVWYVMGAVRNRLSERMRAGGPPGPAGDEERI